MTEEQLIERCRNKDAEALSKLYEKYSSKMLGICYRYVNDLDIAHDLLHDGFITVFSKIADFRGEGSFEGWLRRVFVTTSLGYLRKNKSLKEAGNTDDMRNISGNDPSALEKMSAEELISIISSLPDRYRTVLNLYAVEGFSHKEIAELLNISEGTSRSQYARAKTLLNKKILENQ
ncbi:MAG: sigma-70 family RNA polymerase sigma factor [Rikenellaceae bacterium]|nr:sigma-70 family RNA polymerase sigma factor [Rikenellaceae bacterium]